MTLPNWLRPGQLYATLSTATTKLPQPARNGVFLGLCLILPVLLFAAFFDLNVVNPTRIGWLMQHDWGQHVLGWNAWRHMPWSSGNHEDLLANPTGLSVIYTDSNPLFAFFFKPFRDFLPANFQYIGLWFLFCIVLHFTFAYKLIRPHAPNRWAALGGAIALSALPMLYYRMRHDTLVAQWLILWALHLFINIPDDTLSAPERKGSVAYMRDWFKTGQKMLGYAALLGLCGLIHPYILFMVAAIWGGDVLKRFWPALRALNLPVLLDTGVRAAFVFIWPVITLGLSGTYAQGQAAGAGGYGYYSFPLDGWINPVVPEFSAILKAWPLSAGQAFEGYQYLGFGLIILVVTAVVAYLTTSEARQARPFLSSLKPLILPFIVLLLIALSNHAQVYGYTIWKFQLPDFLRGPAAILRASGRLTWPMTYLLIIAALVVLFKSRPRLIAVMLPLILVIQAYDIHGLSVAMRKATSLSASNQIYYTTPSPAWDALIRDSKGIDFYPANVHLNEKLFYELTWRATSAAKPVNTMYAARVNLIQLAHQEAGMDAFKRGITNPDRLFVFLKQCDVPSVLWPKLRMLDGVWIIPPAGTPDMGLPRPEWSPLRSEVRFGWLDQGTCLLDENWSPPDNDGVWSEGPTANLRIPIKYVEFDTPRPKKLDLRIKARSREPVQVTVVVNDIKVSEISLNRSTSLNTIHLPRSALRGDSLKIRFFVEQPDAPKAPPIVGAKIRRNTGVEAAQPEPIPATYLGIKLIDIKLLDPKAEADKAKLKG
ncbi:MAG: DUF6311 domain-containing protein [Asticcacaulis sp.]